MLLPTNLTGLTVRDIESLTIPQLEDAIDRWIEEGRSTGAQVFINLRARLLNLHPADPCRGQF